MPETTDKTLYIGVDKSSVTMVYMKKDMFLCDSSIHNCKLTFANPYVLFFSYTYISMMKFNLQIRYGKRLTIIIIK